MLFRRFGALYLDVQPIVLLRNVFHVNQLMHLQLKSFGIFRVFSSFLSRVLPDYSKDDRPKVSAMSKTGNVRTNSLDLISVQNGCHIFTFSSNDLIPTPSDSQVRMSGPVIFLSRSKSLSPGTSTAIIKVTGFPRKICPGR